MRHFLKLYLLFPCLIACTWSLVVNKPPSNPGPALWRQEQIDFSAARDFLVSHYQNSIPQPYFDHIGDDGKCLENIYNARRGFWDDDAHELVEPSIQRCGFELQHAPSAVTDYENLEQIQTQYLPLLRSKVLPKAFSGERISDIVFWHPMYRGDDQVISGNIRETLNNRLPTASIAPLAHIDTDVGAFERIEEVARLVGNNRVDDPEQAETFSQQALEEALASGRRFCIVNLWRNADPDHPVLRAPLAVWSTQYKTPGGSHACFPDAKPDLTKSRWYTFPQIMTTEVMLFLQYDRDIQQTSDLWHCALATVKEDDAPPRRSFDVRALVVFEETVQPENDRFAEDRTRPTLARQESECFCEAQAKSEGLKVRELVEKLQT